MSVADWAQAFSGPMTRARLAPDYLAKTNDYVGDFVGRIAELGRTGSFWTPG